MSEQNNSPLGIFGGTFDPVHMGHLRLAEEAREFLGLGEVVWVPAGQPPHRSTPRTAPAHRLAMVQLAVAGNPLFSVDACEVEAYRPSYTVHTLTHLREKFGETRPFVLLLGADAFAGLPGWHRWQEIFALSHVAVLHRPGFSLQSDQLPEPLAREFDARCIQAPGEIMNRTAGFIVPLTMTQLDISATGIRAMLNQGKSPRYLLGDSVLDYIHQHQLYESTLKS